MPVQENTISRTSDYDRFSFLNSNRHQLRGHINTLKNAFEQMGNLTKTQPIIVNEKHQIIDGQHRFVVCKELEIPVYYTVIEGLNIEHARSMNILQASWTAPDFAHSYAVTGNENYIKYLEIRESYPKIPHSVVIAYIAGMSQNGIHKEFRSGNLVVEDLEEVYERLSKLSDVIELQPTATQRGFSMAFLRVIKHEDYKHDRFINKLRNYGATVYEQRFGSEDNLRMIENVYNYRNSDLNRVRLF